MSDEKKPDQEKRTQGPQTYVVQIERELLLQGSTDDVRLAWVDIATVVVPSRTTRRTVIKRALAEAGIEPGDVAPRVRALDFESAFVYEPEAKQPPPEWSL